MKPKALAKTLNDNDTYHLTLDRQSTQDFACELTIEERKHIQSVKAYWFDETTQSRVSVMAGSGEPQFTLPNTFTEQAIARQSALARLEQFSRHKASIRIDLPGTPNLVAESKVTIINHREGYNGTWVVESVSHELGAKQVFTTQLTATLEGAPQ